MRILVFVVRVRKETCRATIAVRNSYISRWGSDGADLACWIGEGREEGGGRDGSDRTSKFQSSFSFFHPPTASTRLFSDNLFSISDMAPPPDLSSEPWLSSVLSNTHHSPSPSPLLIVSSDSHSLSPLPLVKHFISQATPSHPVLLISALVPPKKLGVEKGRSVEVIDLTEDVPGYGEEGVDEEDVEKRVRAIVKKRESIRTFFIDAVVLRGTNGSLWSKNEPEERKEKC